MNHQPLLRFMMGALSKEEKRLGRTHRAPIYSPALERKMAHARATVAEARFLASRDEEYAEAARAFHHARWLRQLTPFQRAIMRGVIAHTVRTIEGWS
jgi:hypothetical protein